MKKVELIVGVCVGLIAIAALSLTIHNSFKLGRMHTLAVSQAEVTSSNAKTLHTISVLIKEKIKDSFEVPAMDTSVAEKLVQDAKNGISILSLLS